MNFGQPIGKYRTWFAWYPVKVDDGSYVWLEYVNRLKEHVWDRTYFEYYKIKED